jgi:hypothetical protein
MLCELLLACLPYVPRLALFSAYCLFRRSAFHTRQWLQWYFAHSCGHENIRFRGFRNSE